MTKTEIMARAMYEHARAKEIYPLGIVTGLHAWEKATGLQIKFWFEQAQAALAALDGAGYRVTKYEPDKTMRKAGAGNWATSDPQEKARITFQRMLDAGEEE